ncbi:hypothetical protein BKA62DRAFT_830596 [Auriculariales sp. MPI-PUGE-AT-0066]|nr:hypothetical protein BKA62DRAFT_830596 [Auriculariales sp. MPI-PUGE-AT-0066]
MASAPLYGVRRLHINMLPPEVLQLIFIWGRVGLRSQQPITEVACTHVCRHWRLIAMDTPRIWNLMHVKRTDWLIDLELLNEWFRRCKSAPIHVVLRIIDRDLWDEERACQNQSLIDKVLAGFALILSNVHRFSHFDVHFGSNAIMCKHAFLKQLMHAGQAPLLETLSLSLENVVPMESRWLPPEELQVYLRPLFDGCTPKLRELSLWGLTANRDMNPHLFQALHKIELGLQHEEHQSSYRAFQNMLSSNPDLDALELNFCGPSRSPAWPPATEDHIVHLDKMKSIALAGFDNDELCQLIDLVRIPNLQRLSIQFEAANPQQDGAFAYDTFLHKLASVHPTYNQPYFPHLSLLHMESLECSRDVLFDLFASLRSLQHLELELSPTNTWCIQLLAMSTTLDSSSNVTFTGIMLPQLETLKLFHPPEERVSVGPDIAEVLTARCTALGGLRLGKLTVQSSMLPRDASSHIRGFVHQIEFIDYFE